MIAFWREMKPLLRNAFLHSVERALAEFWYYLHRVYVIIDRFFNFEAKYTIICFTSHIDFEARNFSGIKFSLHANY